MSASHTKVAVEVGGTRTEEAAFLRFARAAAAIVPEGQLIIEQFGDPESDDYRVEELWLDDVIRTDEDPSEWLYSHYASRLHELGFHYAWRRRGGFVIYR